jgi:hypothetical protein
MHWPDQSKSLTGVTKPEEVLFPFSGSDSTEAMTPRFNDNIIGTSYLR